MRAPVYRAVDSENTFLGLAFPSEVLVVLAVFWGTAVALPGTLNLVATVGAYAALRLLTLGKPPMHLQHLLLFTVRKNASGGRFSPAARPSLATTVFPFSQRRVRDVPPVRSQ